MEMRNDFDEERARRLLAGGEAELAEGLGLIDRQLRGRLCSWLRRSSTLDEDAIANTWAETMLCVLQAVRAGRFDPACPLIRWLCRIVHARAVDWTRRTRCRRLALATLGQALQPGGTERGAIAAGMAERREVVALIQEAIGTLPARQRRVLQVFVEHYPESAAMEVLREEVSRVSGRMETLASVKRALQEARVKVRSFMRRKGYSLNQCA